MIKPVETISAMDARKSLGQMLEIVYYQNKAFTITRKDKPMAWLVGGAVFESFLKIIEEDGALKETLAVMLNKEAIEAIKVGEREYSKREGLVSLADLE